MLHVLFEEDGSFKTGSILTDNDTSLQVETATGKRVKLKAAQILLRYKEPAPQKLLEHAQQMLAELETEFLWEVCAEGEFMFTDLAADYYGHTPSPVEATALLLKLQDSPVHFHRRGKGKFRKAPADIVAAALAGLEKKRLQAEQVERMKQTLLDGTLPDEFRPILLQLLFKPDRNRLETKALEAACAETGQSATQLLLERGALPSTYDYHFGRFLYEFFPQGTDFPAFTTPTLPTDLPVAEVQAFSIDDASTTEIDDAFSVVKRADGSWQIGIHIAAPGLGIQREDSLDAIARQRLSTVYMPGNKITMLPPDLVEQFTLAAGRTVPALSLYLTVATDLRITAQDTRIEAVPIVANLRHHEIEPLFNDDTLANGLGEFAWKDELVLLHELACVLEAGRGKSSSNQNFMDYNFSVDWDAQTTDGPGRVSIDMRKRGSPLDKLVAELMIVANSSWGKYLHEAKVPAIYRTQGAGKVRMTTVAGGHEGLGVDCYAWSSSPLRRYVDLINQWQLISTVRGETPVFAPKSAELLGALRDFDITYSAYAELQRSMERYWCCRYLRDHQVHEIHATLLRENLYRLDGLPLVQRVPSAPTNLRPGSRVALTVESTDLMAIEVNVRFLRELEESPVDVEEEILEDMDEAEAVQESLPVEDLPDQATPPAPAAE